MTWLPLALLAALSWAIGNVLAKKGLENVSPLWNNLLFNFFGLVVWLPFALVASNFQVTTLTLPVAGTLLLTFSAYYLYFYTLTKGELALTGTVIATYPVATIILSSIFFGEKLSLFQMLGIIIVIVGSILVALPERNLPKNVQNYSWLRYGIITSLLIGIGDFIAKYSVNQLGSYSYLFYAPLFLIILSIINFILDKKNRSLPKINKKNLWPTFIGGLLLSLGNIFFFLAYGVGNASLVAPISSVYPALMVVLAVIFLKEKITKKQILGITLIVLGIIAVGIN